MVALMLLIMLLLSGLCVCHAISTRLLPSKPKRQAVAEDAWSNLLDINLDEDEWDGWVVHRYTAEEYREIRR